MRETERGREGDGRNANENGRTEGGAGRKERQSGNEGWYAKRIKEGKRTRRKRERLAGVEPGLLYGVVSGHGYRGSLYGRGNGYSTIACNPISTDAIYPIYHTLLSGALSAPSLSHRPRGRSIA